MGNRTKIYGVGINDADYVTSPKINGKQVPCPYYSTWKSMFVRSYSKKYQYKQTTYEGCYVDEIWHKFSNLIQYMRHI